MKIKDFLIKFIPFSLFFIVGIFVIFGSNNPHYTISGSYFEYNDHLISNSESLKITEYTQGNDKMFIIELYNVDLPQKIYYSLIPDSKGKKTYYLKNEINGKELENIEIKFKENKIFLREKDSKKDYCFVKNGQKNIWL